jgi:hypothetical protein
MLMFATRGGKGMRDPWDLAVCCERPVRYANLIEDPAARWACWSGKYYDVRRPQIRLC